MESRLLANQCSISAETDRYCWWHHEGSGQKYSSALVSQMQPLNGGLNYIKKQLLR